jgi:hypothetical protein
MDNKRITTSLKIKDAPFCRNCPARLYTKENDVIKYGKGMYFAEVMFVLPTNAIWSKDIENYLNLICEEIIDINSQYITYHPKCPAGSPVNDYDDYCKPYLLYEIQKIQPKIVIFFGVDIPSDIYNTPNIPFKLYKFNDLYSIKYGSKTIQYFRELLKRSL